MDLYVSTTIFSVILGKKHFFHFMLHTLLPSMADKPTMLNQLFYDKVMCQITALHAIEGYLHTTVKENERILHTTH